ncbi:mandelate racemase/muconate lactonizing enzyme family protein [Chromohalobacter israelensis]|uniref:mandelate racemase/muconate lactonizing enzyme family protein n=1 Tax=Chromohalobacter israelensis TaxID=141390 RepID=UPI0005557688|nr:dipeptide epimerase [Chromohalobacter israelensis]MDF9434662.1 dipeptide epimerase [Chromohalobacter israelensis]
MTIKCINLHGIRLPLKRPFKIAYDTYEDIESLVVSIESTSGDIGWGEAVVDQHVSGETWQSARNVIARELAPLLIGKPADDIGAFHHAAEACIRHNPSAKAALDIALHDLLARQCRQPLYALLGGRCHARLELPCVISMLPPEEMARQASEACQNGYRSVKIKLGDIPEADIERIARVREALSPGVHLRVDANQGWSAKQALHVIRHTESYGVDWYEQPVDIENLGTLVRVTHATDAVIMADEPIHGLRDMLQVIRLEAADMVNIKLMKSAGLHAARAMAELGMAANIPCQVGSMVESSIATLAGAHLSIAHPNIIANDLVGPTMISSDVADMPGDGTHISLDESPGLGVRIDRDRVHELSVFEDIID